MVEDAGDGQAARLLIGAEVRLGLWTKEAVGLKAVQAAALERAIELLLQVFDAAAAVAFGEGAGAGADGAEVGADVVLRLRRKRLLTLVMG